MSAVVVDGGLIHYETLGRGRPVVFLHGWLNSWRYWMETMGDLSIHFRTYALDFWGFGDSDRKPSKYTLPQLIRQLELFLDELGIWKCDLVGHDLGGLVAVGFALRAPTRVGQLATVSLPFRDQDISPRLVKSAPSVVLDSLLPRRSNNFHTLRIEAERTDAQAVVTSVGSLKGLDIRRQKMPQRWLAVHGEKDDLVSYPHPADLGDRDGQFRFLVLDEMRHFPMIEKRVKFNRLLQDFLRGDALASIAVKEEWRKPIP